MAQSIKFRKGVSRLEDAPIEAPWDLRNAYIKPSHVVEVLSGTTTDSSPPNASARKGLAQHNKDFFSVLSSLHYRGLMYASEDTPSRISVYPQGKSNAEGDLPRVIDINKTDDGGKRVKEFTDERVVHYVFIPVNRRGEAGIWHYEAWVLQDGTARLPRFEIKATPQTDYVEVYKTAEMKEGEKENPTQSLHYLGRFSDSVVEALGDEFFTATNDNNTGGYVSATGISYIYVGGIKIQVDGPTGINNIPFDIDIQDWRIVFEELHSTNNLSTDTTYYISGTQDNGTRLNLVDSNGNSLSFDGSDVVKAITPVGAGGVTNFEGVPFHIKPPLGFESPAAQIFVEDTKQWAWDSEVDGDELDKQPTTRSLERDRSLHGRTVVKKSASGSNRASDDRFTISGEDASDLYSVGDTVSFDPGSTILITASSNVLGEFNMNGYITLSIDQADTVFVKINDVKIKSNGSEHVFDYEVSGGSPGYTVELQNRATFSGGSFGTATQNSESSTGKYQISNSSVDPKSSYEYRIKVTDSNGDTGTTNSRFISAQQSEDGQGSIVV